MLRSPNSYCLNFIDAREGDKEEEKKEEDMDTQDEGESLVNDLKFYGFDLNEMKKVLTSEICENIDLKNEFKKIFIKHFKEKK